MKHLLMAVFILLLTVSTVFGAISPVVVSAPNLEVCGDTIFVPINLENTFEIGSFQLPLKWTEGFKLVDINFGDTRIGRSDYEKIVIRNDAEHEVLIVCYIMDSQAPWLAKGNGVIAELMFIGESNCFEIYSEVIQNPNNSNIIYKPLFVIIDDNNKAVGVISEMDVSTSIDENILPTNFELSQNYPNPFNPITVINYTLPHACHTSIVVYNTLGQEVETLVDTYQSVGYYSITWDATNIASGMYFYSISAGTHQATKKMIILK